MIQPPATLDGVRNQLLANQVVLLIVLGLGFVITWHRKDKPHE